MRSLLSFVLLWTAFVAACTSPGGGEDRATASGKWRLVELEGVDLAQLARVPELVVAADGALSGFAGVNHFSGRLDMDLSGAGRLQAGPMIATRMAGPPEAMEAEALFLALLGEGLAWRRSGSELELLRGGAVQARFTAAE